MKRYFALGLAAWLLALGGARAEGPDDDYVQIYNVIQQADTLNSGGSPSQAMAKYIEAQKALQSFHRTYPDWNPRIFNYRLDYVAGQIAALAGKVPAAPVVGQGGSNAPGIVGSALPGAKAAPVKAPEVTEMERQLGYLQEQVRYLQGDKQLLEAKLKEALSAQPAAVDPREMARAEGRVEELEKENDLLRVTLSEKAKAASGPAQGAAAGQSVTQAPSMDSKALAEAQAALAAANHQLIEQQQKANSLAQDKKFLEAKLAQLSPSPENASAVESTRKALAEANRQLAEQKEQATELSVQNQALQAKVKASNRQTEAVAALRAENALLKKQAAEAKAAAAALASKPSPNRSSAETQAQLAALESERDVLRVEKDALEHRLKQMAPGAAPVPAPTTPAPTPAVVQAQPVVQTRTVFVTNTVAVPSAKPEEVARLKALERERDELQKELKAANKALNNRKSQSAAARVSELEAQLTELKTRLDVYETRRLPFTAEELAAFNQPPPKAAVPQSAPKPAQHMSRESIALVSDAQRYFVNHQYDKAEDAYLQVLRKDQTNVVALANLATIELENNHLEAAETNILQALVVAPDDAYSLSILGYLRYRQHQFDAALDALGRAAKFDPQNAQVQNYLGITLAEKGLRGPAEAAFRKAIQAEPNYADAHVNLALIYVAQQPPATELARWHYQRALTAGHAREPYLEKALATKQ